MLKISPKLQRFLGQVAGFLVVVSSTLFANWLWQKYTAKIELKNEMIEERQTFLAIARKVIEETEYNCTSGIGDDACPFQLEAHHELLCCNLMDCLPKNTKSLVREIVRLGGLCNGGRTSRKVTPGAVKVKSLELKEELQKMVEVEPVTAAPPA